jgi:hypothetical protein
MKRLILISALILVAGSASAQVATGVGTAGAGNGPLVDITISGTVTSAVSLSVTGAGATALSSTTSPASGPGTGTVAFGSFSAQNPSAATNADFAGRTTSGTTGALVAAKLSATLNYSGATTGTVTLARKNAQGALPDIPAASLRVASPALASWAASTDGTQVPASGAAGYNICTGAPGTNCVNGTAYVHNLTVFVPDTQAAGPFSTVVEYTGTAL